LKDSKFAFRVALHLSAEGFRKLGGRPLVLEVLVEVEGEAVVSGCTNKKKKIMNKN